MLSFKPTTPEHITPIAADMRTIDRMECERQFRRPVAEVLRHSVQSSSDPWTAFFGSAPVAIMGVSTVNMLERHGCVWFLASRAVDRSPRLVAKVSKPVFEIVSQGWETLENRVLVENEASARWLAWLGFDVGPPLDGWRYAVWDRPCVQ